MVVLITSESNLEQYSKTYRMILRRNRTNLSILDGVIYNQLMSVGFNGKGS